MENEKTYKIVINTCYGGFGLSKEALDWLKNKGMTEDEIDAIKRHDSRLVECVETLGERASYECSKLTVMELPSYKIPSKKYYIDEYDGMESIITPELMDKLWENLED